MESDRGGKQDALSDQTEHTDTHTEGKKQALTSDSPGRPRPESDTFCHLKQKEKRLTEQKKEVGEERKEGIKVS